MDFNQWREQFEKQQAARNRHIDEQFTAQNIILEEIRGYLAFSKVGAKLLLWGASVGAALATILAFWHGPPK